MVRAFLGAAASLTIGTVGLGCGRPETVADRQFAEMRETVEKLQAEHDTSDQRAGALELGDDEKAKTPPSRPANATSSAPPASARVVQLGEPSDGENADPNDTSARPEIRVTGAAGAVRSSTERPRAGKNGRTRPDARDTRDTRDTRGDDADTSGLGSLRGDGRPSSALDPEAKQAYEAALAQVQAKQYDRGLEGLGAFLTRWPDHPYAENAMYWRGEAYFGQGEYLRAAEQFEAVVTRFGSGNKAPDALLKLGMCQERLGATSRAREYWDRLKADYPRSDAAKRIPAAARERTAPGPKENR